MKEKMGNCPLQQPQQETEIQNHLENVMVCGRGFELAHTTPPRTGGPTLPTHFYFQKALLWFAYLCFIWENPESLKNLNANGCSLEQ